MKGEFINPCGARGAKALPAPPVSEFPPPRDSNCLSLDTVLKSFNPVERYMRKVQRGFKGLLEAVGAVEEFHSCTEEAWRALELP